MSIKSRNRTKRCFPKENSRGQSAIQLRISEYGFNSKPESENKKMNCENLQFNLSIYFDDVLTVEERAAIEEHLPRCPLCRQKLADFQSLRNDLRVLPRPALPNNLLISVRNRIAEEIKSNKGEPSFTFAPFIFTENFRERVQARILPYAIGTFASLVFGFALLWSLLSAANLQQNAGAKKYEPFADSGVLLANANAKTETNDFDLSSNDFSAARLSVSEDSPSVNPRGALIALTKSFVRGKMKDDEVVVVADVFGNGLAKIAEVVEPSKDIRAVYELEKALKNDPDYAPFVPAKLDQRSEIVRVVFKIQSVNVKTHLPAPKK